MPSIANLAINPAPPKRPEDSMHTHIAVLAQRYTSIGIISKLLQVTPATLRYWERRYPRLRLHLVGQRARRRYRPEEFLLIIAIHELITHIGMTLEGAIPIANAMDPGRIIDGKIQAGEDWITRGELRKEIIHALSRALAVPENAEGEASPPGYKGRIRLGAMSPAKA